MKMTQMKHFRDLTATELVTMLQKRLPKNMSAREIAGTLKELAIEEIQDFETACQFREVERVSKEKPVEAQTRTLKSGRKVNELLREYRMTISSKCPEKWLFVDLETVNVWHADQEDGKPSSRMWRAANECELKELMAVGKIELKNLRAWKRSHHV